MYLFSPLSKTFYSGYAQLPMFTILFAVTELSWDGVVAVKNTSGQKTVNELFF